MSEQTRALTRLAFDELSRAAEGIGGVHRGIADRAFGLSGPGATPARLIHDRVVGLVYRGVGGGLRLAGHASRLAPERPVSTTPKGAATLAIVNGLIGDVLESEGSPLAEPMGFRVAGEAVAAADAAPDDAEKVVVFIHGLFESEFAWRQRYGSRLMEEHGWTPLYVRYNSGLPVADNGARLAELLDELPPVPIALVGHSMGGLVARHACAQGGEWTERVSHVISLGSPYMGSPVARGVDRLAKALGLLPETRPFGTFFDRRSAGVRDLESGCADVAPIAGPRHCFVSAGRDLLVMKSSAVGEGETFHLPGAGHFALLDHPQVYERLRDWLAA